MAKYTATADIWRDFERAAAEARREARQAQMTSNGADERIARARQHPRWPIAVHEAGHVVVAVLGADRTISEATIEQRRQPDGTIHGGQVRLVPLENPNRQSEWEDVIIALAGAAAQGRVEHDFSKLQAGAVNDDEWVTREMARVGASREEIASAQRTANSMINHGWHVIEEVAAELIEKTTIGDAEVKAAIARAKARKTSK